MVQKITKRTQVTIGAALVVVVALIGTVFLLQALSPKEQDPYKESSTAQKDEANSLEKETPSNTDNSTSQQGEQRGGAMAPEGGAVDPANVGTVNIPSLDVTVSYVKGIGGFEYEILRTPNGTRYVEFRSPSLAGTKCTNDLGAFASILADPQSAEQSTLAKSVTVDGTFYGLSLPTASCTSDPDGLAAYQKSFSDAFNLLKKTN